MGEGFDEQAAGKAGFQRETHRFHRQRAEDPGHDETFGHTHCKHEQHTNPRQQNPGIDGGAQSQARPGERHQQQRRAIKARIVQQILRLSCDAERIFRQAVAEEEEGAGGIVLAGNPAQPLAFGTLVVEGQRPVAGLGVAVGFGIDQLLPH